MSRWTRLVRDRRWRIIVVAAGSFGVFTLIGLIGSAWDGPLDPTKVGTLGEWAAAVGAVAALTVALWEVASAQSRQEEADEQALEVASAAREAARRAQAEQVTVWCSSETVTVQFDPRRHVREDEALFDPRAYQQTVVVSLANGSDLPVFNAVIRHVWWRDFDTRGRGGMGRIVLGPIAVGPKTRIDEEFTRLPSGESEQWPAVDLEFTDAAGRAWRRNPVGELEEIERSQFIRSSGNWPREDSRAEYREVHGLPPLDDEAN